MQVPVERLKSHPDSVKKLLLDHVVLGQRLDLGIGADLSFTTLGGRTVNIKSKPGEGKKLILFHPILEIE